MWPPVKMSLTPLHNPGTGGLTLFFSIWDPGQGEVLLSGINYVVFVFGFHFNNLLHR